MNLRVNKIKVKKLGRRKNSGGLFLFFFYLFFALLKIIFIFVMKLKLILDLKILFNRAKALSH